MATDRAGMKLGRHEMELGPKVRGKTIKSIRVDPVQLKAFREELKGNKQWADYAQASDAELHRIAVVFARGHISPEMYVLTLEAVNQIVDEAVRNAIGSVAKVLGGVAQMNADKSITVLRPGADAAETFQAKPVAMRRPNLVN